MAENSGHCQSREEAFWGLCGEGGNSKCCFSNMQNTYPWSFHRFWKGQGPDRGVQELYQECTLILSLPNWPEILRSCMLQPGSGAGAKFRSSEEVALGMLPTPTITRNTYSTRNIRAAERVFFVSDTLERKSKTVLPFSSKTVFSVLRGGTSVSPLHSSILAAVARSVCYTCIFFPFLGFANNTK